MKLSLATCLLLPSLAAGFAVPHGGGLGRPSACLTCRRMVTPEEQSPEAVEETVAASASASEEESPAAPGPEPTDQAPAEALGKKAKAAGATTFVQTGAAPTFSATAPAGMPPEIVQAGGYQSFHKYRTLDQEMNARAAQSGWAAAGGPPRASFSATAATDNAPAESYYKYRTLNQMENARAARKGFAAQAADSAPRVTFSATDATNDLNTGAGAGSFYKYRTLNQEDNERAVNASYRVTYSATQATDTAGGSSNIPVVQNKKKGDEEVKEEVVTPEPGNPNSVAAAEE